jgi:RNA polymerase sigma factor (sigma-70 family)
MLENNINITLIVEGCRRSNRNSQRKLFEHFFAYAMSVCLRYAKNREEAEEILNNVFLKVFRFIDKYDSEYPFRIWLRKILINTSIDYHRANHKHLSFLEIS